MQGQFGRVAAFAGRLSAYQQNPLTCAVDLDLPHLEPAKFLLRHVGPGAKAQVIALGLNHARKLRAALQPQKRTDHLFFLFWAHDSGAKDQTP